MPKSVFALALLLAACAPSIPATPEFLADREGRISRALAKAGRSDLAKMSMPNELSSEVPK